MPYCRSEPIKMQAIRALDKTFKRPYFIDMSQLISHSPKWSLSSTGKPIELYEFHNSSLLTQPLLFVGGVHGDEPEGVYLAQQLLRWLQKQEQQGHIKQMQSWILIPCWNVDGYEKNQRTNARGVDLNRNFPSKDWSPSFEKPRYFPGPHSGSEPETQALASLIVERSPCQIVHFHSWKPCIVVTGKRGHALGAQFAKSSGYELQEDIGYPTPGSLGQYGWLDHGIPVTCIEEQEGVLLNDEIWNRFKNAFAEILFSKEPW